MNVTYPHMGTMSVALQAMLEKLQLTVTPPPPITSKTLSLGAKHSPESVCLPFKINIGNFIEASEHGADTIVMAGGIGPCRFGYYAQLQREILKDLNIKMDMIVLEPPEGMITEIWRKLSPLTSGHSMSRVAGIFYFAWRLGRQLDKIEQELNLLRAEEEVAGSCDRIWDRALSTLGAARDFRHLRASSDFINWQIRTLPLKRRPDTLRVGIVGEIYMLLEPTVNLALEKRLGQMGVKIYRSLYISDWVCEHLLPQPAAKMEARRIKRAASKYLRGFVGGHGLETIGHSVVFAEKKLDGIIQVLPLTCMPEIVAQTILPSISEDYQIPIMTLVLDEHSGAAGLQTRLEAFVDMLRVRQKTAVGGKI